MAFVFTVLLMPIVIRLCRRWNLLDQPGPLKIHSQPVPRLGGVAVVFAISAGMVVVSPVLATREWPFFAALSLVCVTGLIDDLSGLSALIRLASQIIAGGLLWYGGWRVPVFAAAGPNLIATCLFVAAFANAFNFLDGADGIAAGVACIIAAAFATFPGAPGTAFGRAAAWSVAGACAGFLLFNFPPAKIFLGDSGSTAIGLCIAFLGLDSYRSNPVTAAQMLFPILAAALPLLDAALAIFRRIRRGVSPLYGDRSHVYDLLATRGLSPRRVALACYLIAAAFACLGWWGAWRASAQFWFVVVFSLELFIYGALKLGSLRTTEDENRPAPVMTPHAKEERAES